MPGITNPFKFWKTRNARCTVHPEAPEASSSSSAGRRPSATQLPASNPRVDPLVLSPARPAGPLSGEFAQPVKSRVTPVTVETPGAPRAQLQPASLAHAGLVPVEVPVEIPPPPPLEEELNPESHQEGAGPRQDADPDLTRLRQHEIALEEEAAKARRELETPLPPDVPHPDIEASRIRAVKAHMFDVLHSNSTSSITSHFELAESFFKPLSASENLDMRHAYLLGQIHKMKEFFFEGAMDENGLRLLLKVHEAFWAMATGATETERGEGVDRLMDLLRRARLSNSPHVKPSTGQLTSFADIVMSFEVELGARDYPASRLDAGRAMLFDAVGVVSFYRNPTKAPQAIDVLAVCRALRYFPASFASSGCLWTDEYRSKVNKQIDPSRLTRDEVAEILSSERKPAWAWLPVLEWEAMLAASKAANAYGETMAAVPLHPELTGMI